jgi:hypothetical protein
LSDGERQGDGAPAAGGDFRHDGIRFFLAAAIGEEDVDALAGQVQRGIAAQAAAAAGDQGDFARGRLVFRIHRVRRLRRFHGVLQREVCADPPGACEVKPWYWSTLSR